MKFDGVITEIEVLRHDDHYSESGVYFITKCRLCDNLERRRPLYLAETTVPGFFEFALEAPER